MRAGPLLNTFLITGLCLCVQQGRAQQSRPTLANSTRPDVTIVVEKHPTGADIVTITADRADYPLPLLRQQIEALATNLGTTLRGPSVFKEAINPNDPSGSFVRANFGIVGLIDRASGKLGLGALARSFAGAPEPFTVHGLFVQYPTETAGPRIIRSLGGPKSPVQVEGSYFPNTGIEYRLKLNSQDPSKIVVPEGDEARKPALPPQPPQSQSNSLWVLALLFGVTAIALGALVYSLLLRPRATPRMR